MFHFAWIWMFLLLPLPWVVRYALPAKNDKPEGVLNIPFYQRLVAAQASERRGQASFGLILKAFTILTWLLIVIAVARPEWLGQPVAIERNGRDIMMAIDISGSMGSPDLVQDGRQFTRFDVVQDVASQFVSERTGDRLGLILFGTRAYLQTPLTFDRNTVVEMLSDASIGLAGPKTAIGDSIGLAIKRLMDEPVDNRVLILLTDGASNAGSVTPLEAAKLAAKEHVKIYTVGLGADSLTVNSLFGPQRINPSRDLDEKTLKEVAELTGGLYFRAKDQEGLAEVYEAINRLEPLAGDSDMFQPIYSLYVWPLGLALLLSFCLGWFVRAGFGGII